MWKKDVWNVQVYNVAAVCMTKAAATADKLLKETSDSTSQVALLEEEERLGWLPILQKEYQTEMMKPLSLWGEMVPLILEDVIIVDTATKAATDWYVWMNYSSGDIKVMDTLHRCLLLLV